MSYYYPTYYYPNIGVDINAYHRYLYDQYLLQQWHQFYERIKKDEGDFPRDGLIEWRRYRDLQERYRLFLSSSYRPVAYFPMQY